MTTYDTPDPISVTIDIVGDARVTASDRTDTTVAVRPRDPSKGADVKAAEQLVVEFADGRLQIRLPRHWTRYTPFGGGESVSLAIEVPTGSRVDASTGLGDLRCEGELAAVRCTSGMGDIRLDHTGPLQAKSAHGDVVVDRVDGDARLRTGSGDLIVGAVEGPATIKNGNGDTTVGRAGGELQIRSANGDIAVGTAHDSVTARTANGAIRIADVRHGSVVMETAVGELEVGIHAGTAAWLDLNTRFGSVRNALDDSSGPSGADDSVEIRARTAVGDITVRRADRASAATS